jgi:hypothetical protein
VAEPADPQEFLSQAPGREGKYLKVKSVIEWKNIPGCYLLLFYWQL